MNKKIFIYISIAILAIIAAFLIFRPNTAGKETGVILFTRYDCPHCQNVDDYIEQNQIGEKIKIDLKELHESANNALFLDKAAQCGIPEEQLGVPMLFDGTTCYSGDRNIIDFFNEKI